MKHTFSFLPIFIMTLCGLFLVQSASAQAELQRMQERLPLVDELRLNGLVGENNVGLLDARGQLTAEQRAVVNAENADRLSLYRQIARNQGVSVQEVGRQRAIRIAAQARSGVWLQNPAGEWFQKP